MNIHIINRLNEQCFLSRLNSLSYSIYTMVFTKKNSKNVSCGAIHVHSTHEYDISDMTRTDFIDKTIWNIDINGLAFLKSRVHSLAFSPNCHLHCVSASYSSPGSFSGYLYSCMALGSSERQVAWAVLRQKHNCKTAWLLYSRDGHHDNITTVVPLATFRDFYI